MKSEKRYNRPMDNIMYVIYKEFQNENKKGIKNVFKNYGWKFPKPKEGKGKDI